MPPTAAAPEKVVWPAVATYLNCSRDVAPADVAVIQLAPSYTFITFWVVLKYRAPAAKALPSLSSVGSDVFVPR